MAHVWQNLVVLVLVLLLLAALRAARRSDLWLEAFSTFNVTNVSPFVSEVNVMWSS